MLEVNLVPTGVCLDADLRKLFCRWINFNTQEFVSKRNFTTLHCCNSVDQW